MIFKKFATFTTSEEVNDFLKLKLNQSLETLSILLQRLDFKNNFETFEYNGSIANGTEMGITHNLRTIPTQRIIVKQTGDGRIIDGDAAWTSSKVYLKNVGSATTTVTVLFFK